MIIIIAVVCVLYYLCVKTTDRVPRCKYLNMLNIIGCSICIYDSCGNKLAISLIDRSTSKQSNDVTIAMHLYIMAHSSSVGKDQREMMDDLGFFLQWPIYGPAME